MLNVVEAHRSVISDKHFWSRREEIRITIITYSCTSACVIWYV